jgi:hypothetical protein
MPIVPHLTDSTAVLDDALARLAQLFVGHGDRHGDAHRNARRGILQLRQVAPQQGAPTFQARLDTVRAATDAGFPVTVFLMPPERAPRHSAAAAGRAAAGSPS